MLILSTPWGGCAFRSPIYNLAAAGDLIILGQTTLRGVPRIDVMADLGRVVAGVRRGDHDGEAMTLGVDEDRLGMGKT